MVDRGGDAREAAICLRVLLFCGFSRDIDGGFDAGFMGTISELSDGVFLVGALRNFGLYFVSVVEWDDAAAGGMCTAGDVGAERVCGGFGFVQLGIQHELHVFELEAGGGFAVRCSGTVAGLSGDGGGGGVLVIQLTGVAVS